MTERNKMLTIYIASPYTKGDPQENTDKSFDCALDLIEAGFAPYAPLARIFLRKIKWLKL